MFENEEIIKLCNEFGIRCSEVVKGIDSSHGDEDRRYNYNIDNKYFLKINNSKAINEESLEDIVKLIKRYKSIGVYCPNLIRNKEGKLSNKYIKEGVQYTYYVEEFAAYNFFEEGKEVDYNFEKNMVIHLGKLASKFTNVDLSSTRSMWSLIELNPFDKDIDEKQENLNRLIKTLEEKGYKDLGNKLIKVNEEARSRIKRSLNDLPKCVYQGDLNVSNVLVDNNGDFKGLIDFNMFGTEVNINCFLNETMCFVDEEEFKILTSKEILDKMESTQNSTLKGILKNYPLNNLEKELFNDYKKVIYLSLYPNVCLWCGLLKNKDLKEKVVELIDMICEKGIMVV